MSFLSLVGVEFKKDKTLKDISNIVCCDAHSLDTINTQCRYEFQYAGRRNFSRKQFFHSGLYGNGVVYVPCKYGSGYCSFESNRKNKQRYP